MVWITLSEVRQHDPCESKIQITLSLGNIKFLSEKSQLNCDHTTLLWGQRECIVVVAGHQWYSFCPLWAAQRIQTRCKFRAKHRHALGYINKINDYSVSLRAEACGPFHFAFLGLFRCCCLCYFKGVCWFLFLVLFFNFLEWTILL